MLQSKILRTAKIKSYSFFEKHDLNNLILRDAIKTSYLAAFFTPIKTLSKQIYFKFLAKSTPSNLLVTPTTFDIGLTTTYEKFYTNKKTMFFKEFQSHVSADRINKVNMKIKRIRFKPGYMNY